MSEGTKTNKSCPCGSGHKYKNCCMGKKPRLEGIVFEHDHPVVVRSVTIGPNGQISMYDGEGRLITPKQTSFRRSYERERKGEKTITEVPLLAPRLSVNEIEHLSEFEILFALDANTKEHNGRKISAATFIRCNLVKQANSIVATYQVIHQHYWVDLEESAEKIALCDLIANIKDEKGMKVGIITDCDYGNISKINAGEVPIYKDFYLPSSFKLVYASSDAGKEALSNRLISECDKYSSEIIADIITNFSKYVPPLNKNG